MKYLLPIAIQPYLKTYLSYYQDVKPLLVTEKNRFGSYLINSLRFKSNCPADNGEMPKMRYLTGVLELCLPEHYCWNYGQVIPEKCQYRFNNFLFDEFQDRMVEFVAPKVKKKGDLNILLLTFREKYGINEDELSLKTLQKSYQREYHRVSRYKSA